MWFSLKVRALTTNVEELIGVRVLFGHMESVDDSVGLSSFH